VILISALWLAVVQALTSLPVSAPSWVVDTAPAHASVQAAGAVAVTTAARARPGAPVEAELRQPTQGDQEFRPSATQRLLPADRTSSRGAGTLRSHDGPVAITSAELAILLASVSPREAHRVSHAAATRGGHLPYYPTAPPLQG
jgi:hypothetical protein